MSTHAEPPRTDTTRSPRRYLLHPLRPAARLLIRSRHDIRVHGADLVPATGPVVLAANHVGVMDGPVLTVFSPRPVHALTKVEMFEGRMGRFLQASGQIPVDRFRTDPAAVKVALRVLRDGGAVGIFPEGGRGAGEFELFHRGAAYLAMVTGAPIVPVILIGTREPGGHTESVPARGSVVDLVFGAPFEVPTSPWPRTRWAVSDASQDLRSRMLRDLDDALRLTGRSLPGPLEPGQHEPDPGGGVTEASA